MNHPACPSNEELVAIAFGGMPRSIYVRRMEHVRACADCQRILDQFRTVAVLLTTSKPGPNHSIRPDLRMANYIQSRLPPLFPPSPA